MDSTASHRCANCGASNMQQAHFCIACGHALQSLSSTSFASSHGKGTPPIYAYSAEILAPDHLLNKRYRILAHIGSGGYGNVYKAIDNQFGGRSVAIKEMSQYGLSAKEAEQATAAFQHEAFILAKLMHPNLPGIYDYFSEQNRWYLVMSFIEGEPLDEYLDNAPAGRLQPTEALQIGIQLCTVLSYLHNRQPPIIFRDLKPANVMRTPDGQLYLIDFGIARIFKQGQAKDTIALGSPGYAAPEQYGRVQSTPRADIYSLGATLHHLLSGTDPSLDPFMFAPLSLPDHPGLNALILSLLEKDSGKRPASMEIVKQELQQIATGRAPGLVARAISRPSDTPIFSTVDAVSTNEYEQDGAERQQQETQRQQMYEQVAPQRPRPEPLKPGISRRKLLIVGAVAGAGLTTYLAALWMERSSSHRTQRPLATPAPQNVVHPDTHSLSPTSLHTVAWAPDGVRIATSNGLPANVEVQDVARHRTLLTYSGHTGPISSLAWSPDGASLVSASYDTTVQVWDAGTGAQRITYKEHSSPVQAVAWSPDGAYIASADSLHTIRIWNVQTGQTLKVYTDHSDQVTTLNWWPGGPRIASGSADKTVRVWDTVTGTTFLTYTGHSDVVQSVAWSPDGKQIASASNDLTIQVWNAQDGKRTVTYRGHKDQVWSVAWSPDGKYIASASWDTTVQIWNAIDGGHLYTYTGHTSPVLSVTWSSTKTTLASVDITGDVHTWEPPLA